MPSSTPSWAGAGAASVPTPPHMPQNADEHPGKLNGSTPQGNDYSAPSGAPMNPGAGEAASTAANLGEAASIAEMFA